MNDILNNVLYGPLGWKIACMMLTLVGILVLVALIDGPWVRKKETKASPLAQKDLDGPQANVSSTLEQEEQES